MRILAVVAHYDDEALFCGGALNHFREHDLRIAVVTTVSQCNPIDEREAEVERRIKRLAAFNDVADMLDVTETIELNLPNRSPFSCHGTIDRIQPDLVLTHGPDGETGHPQHVNTYNAVRDAWDGPMWCFTAAGDKIVEIDWDFKQKLLERYRDGTTRTGIWDPRTNPAYAPWCRNIERFAPMAPRR